MGAHREHGLGRRHARRLRPGQLLDDEGGDPRPDEDAGHGGRAATGSRATRSCPGSSAPRRSTMANEAMNERIARRDGLQASGRPAGRRERDRVPLLGPCRLRDRRRAQRLGRRRAVRLLTGCRTARRRSTRGVQAHAARRRSRARLLAAPSPPRTARPRRKAGARRCTFRARPSSAPATHRDDDSRFARARPLISCKRRPTAGGVRPAQLHSRPSVRAETSILRPAIAPAPGPGGLALRLGRCSRSRSPSCARDRGRRRSSPAPRPRSREASTSPASTSAA